MPVDQQTRQPVRPGRRPTARQRAEAGRAAEAAARARAAQRRRTVTGATVAATLLAVAVLVVVVVQSQRVSSSPDAAVPAHTTADGAVVEVGSADASATLDVYEDFGCPACGAFEARHAGTLAELAADGDVLLRYHPISILDRAFTDDYPTRAMNAAGVVVDAAGPEAYVRFTQELFARQPAEGGPGLTDDELVGLAREAGAAGPAVERGIRELVFEDWTRELTDRASREGVAGTPTVLLDGEPLDWATLDPAALADAVRAV
ncbi:thioredoxin domain-containing protein [Blastococcus sp. TF02A-30]|uniref:DsbA family protein n=1 Tax=Blastococcus sp. TF02A-30 TaxID=2250580 RepID=UPI000DE96BC2|nr:thioredoxin domain-containing protein [Blastococcus sp. TF02A-30]RBY84931.1 disulfide bond formation protein DsbA [Blastococcus sp. TF02A-30]